VIRGSLPVVAEGDDGKEHVSAAFRLVCFQLAGQELGFPIEAVRETIRLRPITRVILTPPWLVGIFSLRGEIVPAIDIAPWLGMPAASMGTESRLVVLRNPGKPLGVLVDQLAELRTLDRGNVAPPPPTLAPAQAALIRGVATTPTGTVRIVDADALVASDAMRSLRTPSPN
jgi:purine-binding chemotaxis protein CheW